MLSAIPIIENLEAIIVKFSNSITKQFLAFKISRSLIKGPQTYSHPGKKKQKNRELVNIFNAKTYCHFNYIRVMKQWQKKTPITETLSLFEQVAISESLIQAPAVKLPELRFDIAEQLSIALQNRDKDALGFLISDSMISDPSTPRRLHSIKV